MARPLRIQYPGAYYHVTSRGGAYTIYFNIKHKRAGHLFQGRYKAIIVDADAYAGELSRYIHLNPVRGGIVNMPEKYMWSSYQYYIRKRNLIG